MRQFTIFLVFVCSIPKLCFGLQLNEIRIDQFDETNPDRYFEIKGSPGESLDGIFYVIIGDHSGNNPTKGSGVIEFAVSLDGLTIPDSGFFLGTTITFSLAVLPTKVFPSLFFEGDHAATHILVRGYTGPTVESFAQQEGERGFDIDTNDDGVIDVALPWIEVIDAVAVSEPENGRSVHAYGEVLGGVNPQPFFSFVANHIFRGILKNEWIIGSINIGSMDTPGFENPAIISIPDIALESTIRDALGKPNGGLTEADLATLSELSVAELNIADLNGLEFAVNLTLLNLSKNQINDLSPLSGLTSLTELDLRVNQINDLSPLSGLTALKVLILSGNQIIDLLPLSGITALVDLRLDFNQISDLSPLSGLTALNVLFLSHNQISDLSPLSDLRVLSDLFLSTNQISNLSPLSELTALNTLVLFTNQISDLSPLSGLTALSELWLSTNWISDLNPLSGLNNLNVLFLFENQISDLNPLRGLTNLTSLFLRQNFLDLREGSTTWEIIVELEANGTEVSYLPQKLDHFRGLPIANFPGWMASPWYLNYNIDFWPWIFHDEHGWQFVSENSTEDVIFLFDLGLQEWLFLNQSTYRWQFLFSDTPGWIWTFGDNTPDRRFFQRLDDGSLFSVPEGLQVD